MMLLTMSSASSYAQTLTVLVIFVVVLAVTAWATKWIANYQKGQTGGRNMEVIETARLANNKWIQIVRVGTTYKVVAIGKDTVTYLGEVDPDSIHAFSEETASFGNLFSKALMKTRESQEPQEESGEETKDERP